MPKLPENSFALFIMNKLDPLIIENSEAVYLGRLPKIPTATMVDLTDYNGAELGSRARMPASPGLKVSMNSKTWPAPTEPG